MNVSMPPQAPIPDGTAGAMIPSVGRDMLRRIRMAEGLQMLLRGVTADADDTALFRRLLSDDVGGKSGMGADQRNGDPGGESVTIRPDRQEEVVRVASRQASVDGQESDAQDTAPVAPLDLVALGGVVTRVYLDRLYDRERGVDMAVNEDLLPATRLSVREQAGRLAIDFVSMNPQSRGRLRRGAPALSKRMAMELSRDVSVSVAAHDGDRLALEVRANASPAPPSRGAV